MIKYERKRYNMDSKFNQEQNYPCPQFRVHERVLITFAFGLLLMYLFVHGRLSRPEGTNLGHEFSSVLPQSAYCGTKIQLSFKKVSPYNYE